MGHDAAYVDQIQSSSGTIGWAAAIPTKETLAAFSAARTAADAAEHPCPPTPEIDESIKVGGDPGRLTIKHCPADGGILVANTAVIHDGNGFFFYFQDPGHYATDSGDLAVFKTLLGGVTFP